jgi:hypothetical protein
MKQANFIDFLVEIDFILLKVQSELKKIENTNLNKLLNKYDLLLQLIRSIVSRTKSANNCDETTLLICQKVIILFSDSKPFISILEDSELLIVKKINSIYQHKIASIITKYRKEILDKGISEFLFDFENKENLYYFKISHLTFVDTTLATIKEFIKKEQILNEQDFNLYKNLIDGEVKLINQIFLERVLYLENIEEFDLTQYSVEEINEAIEQSSSMEVEQPSSNQANLNTNPYQNKENNIIISNPKDQLLQNLDPSIELIDNYQNWPETIKQLFSNVYQGILYITDLARNAIKIINPLENIKFFQQSVMQLENTDTLESLEKAKFTLQNYIEFQYLPSPNYLSIEDLIIKAQYLDIV